MWYQNRRYQYKPYEYNFATHKNRESEWRMKLAPDHLFIVSIMTVNTLVLLMLSIPKYRKKLPSIYLITRSWWWMLALLFGCYLLSQLPSVAGNYPYSWVLDGLFLAIGLQGVYEISRLWKSSSKNKLLTNLATQKALLNSNDKSNEDSINNSAYNHSLASVARINLLDICLLVALISLIISLISLHHLTLDKGVTGVLLFVLFASQFNDIAQYLCGRWLGGRFFARKLAPMISPNKTIEGAIFGSLLAASLATVLGMLLTPFSGVTNFILAYFLAVSGIAGDLFESAFKRRHGIKNTGTLLAGHGGLLDRIDSLLIGVPLFTLIYWVLY